MKRKPETTCSMFDNLVIKPRWRDTKAQSRFYSRPDTRHGDKIETGTRIVNMDDAMVGRVSIPKMDNNQLVLCAAPVSQKK